MKTTEIIRKLYTSYNERTEWLDSLPATIRDGYFDNEYVESLESNLTMLTAELFTADLYEDVYSFMFDNCKSITIGSITYHFNGIEDFIQYVKDVHGEE